MTDFTKRVDISAMKNNQSDLKAIIKKVLKVDSSPTSLNDIQAVADGFTDYNTAKGLADKDYYDVRCNLGTKDKPFFTTREIGYVDNIAEAQRQAHILLNDCKEFMTWFVYLNDKNTRVEVSTRPEPEKGFEYNITISGEKLSDIELALEQVMDSVRSDNYTGFDRNKTGAYNYERAGDEYDPIDDIDIEMSDDYAIIDSQGIIEKNDDQDDIYTFWSNTNINIDSWESFLIFGENVDLYEAKKQPNDIYHAIATTASRGVISGDFEDIIEALKDDERTFVLFRELERV
jgi:hypothetical protein